MLPNDESLYLDVLQLYHRGWTETLIKKFLVKPDRYETVDHWLNYVGKRKYYLGRVEQVEEDGLFHEDFLKSVKRRKLTTGYYYERREVTKGILEAYFSKLTPRDIEVMEALSKAAVCLQEIRNKGYRTPHK